MILKSKDKISFAYVDGQLIFDKNNAVIKNKVAELSDVFGIDNIIRGKIGENICIYKHNSYKPVAKDELSQDLKDSVFALMRYSGIQGKFKVYNGASKQIDDSYKLGVVFIK